MLQCMVATMFTVSITLPDLELDLDMDAIEEAGEEAARASMRVKGGKRGENLKNMHKAANAAAEKEMARQSRSRSIISG